MVTRDEAIDTDPISDEMLAVLMDFARQDVESGELRPLNHARLRAFGELARRRAADLAKFGPLAG